MNIVTQVAYEIVGRHGEVSPPLSAIVIQERIRNALRTWCEKFAAAQEGIFGVAMGTEDGVEDAL
jgi:hypothetical protein